LSRSAVHIVRPARPAPATATKKDDAPVVVAENRKAAFDYHLIETFEAGLVLLGTEVKAIREGVVNLRDSYVRIENGEAFLFKVHIGQYSHAGASAHDPGRTRKLLLNKHELRKLIGKTTEKGMTVVPTRMYFKGGRLKVAIALAKGKKAHDKRETIKKREADRETRAAVKERVR
jgi:SsrA-binding protein